MLKLMKVKESKEMCIRNLCIMSFIMLLALQCLYDVFMFNYAPLHNYDMFQVYVKSNPLWKKLCF